MNISLAQKQRILIFTILFLFGWRALRRFISLLKLRSQRHYIDRLLSDFQKNRTAYFERLKIPEQKFTPEITNILLFGSLTDIKRLLEQGTINSEQLVNYFAQRALSIAHKYNGLADLRYERALQMARNCDSLRRENPELCQGELFGIPISLKENILVKDVFSTGGFVSFIARGRSTEDGTITKLVLAAGAIPLAITTVPQGLHSIENLSNVYGRGLNPWNTTRTSGGSSGGEGIIVSTRCSPVGLGSDVGGSIRLPAAFCGVVGFKPTAMRLPLKGLAFMSPTIMGNIAIRPTLGPIGRCVDDVALFFKSLLNPASYDRLRMTERDHNQLFKPFEESVYKMSSQQSKLRIGYVSSLPQISTPSATSQRAITESIEALRRRGHELVEVIIPDAENTWMVLYEWFGNSGFGPFKELLAGEKELQEYEVYDHIMNMSALERYIYLKRWFDFSSQKSKRQRVHDVHIKGYKPKSAEQYRELIGRITITREKYIAWFEQQGLHALLTPASQLPAYTHDSGIQVCSSHVFCLLMNILNMPAGTLPITLVRNDEQQYNGEISGFAPCDLPEKIMAKSSGLPMSVQVSALPFQEELCLRVMREIEEEVKFKHYPPAVLSN